jgi:hypothetical protein|nr:MAG TPA: hypothetical protein [Caudoviricetes sp.]
MNELEKIQSLQSEIKEKHEKIKQSMFLLVQMLGDKVEPSNGRAFKATEETGSTCTVESLVIEDGKLMVRTDFDGDKFTLDLDSFNAEELASILYLMLEDYKKHLQEKIGNMFKDYVNQHNEEPLYVSCCIKYLDNSPLCDVTIKLSSELDMQDDLLFYYCNSLNDLKSLCEFGSGDFILTDVYEFSDEI